MLSTLLQHVGPSIGTEIESGRNLLVFSKVKDGQEAVSFCSSCEHFQARLRHNRIRISRCPSSQTRKYCSKITAYYGHPWLRQVPLRLRRERYNRQTDARTDSNDSEHETRETHKRGKKHPEIYDLYHFPPFFLL